jgi:transposase
MRRSFDGLAMITRENMGQDPLSGHLFVFFNRRGDRVKIMFWDRSGFCIWYKRLEQGVFRLPQSIVNTPNPEVEATHLSLILQGIDLSSGRRRKRFVLGERQKKYG